MTKTHKTFIRNNSYTTGKVSFVEGHNERKNKNPINADVVPERADMNVHYHQNFTPGGTPETYHQTIDRLLDERKIVKHNFKPNSAIIDDFILDINTSYFEENGGYEFAKKFYEEAYRYAVSEVGSEDYILSAVLHADERNKDISEQLGRDIYHYHLHVVYVPVVQKELKWTKRAGEDLAGKVKEVIPQINHTEKWPRKKTSRGYINEYSKLQDRFYEHMKAAGFDGFERGERGSTAEHLDVNTFKRQQEEKKLVIVSEQVEKKEARLEKLDAQISVKEKAKATIAEVESMGHKLPVVPGVHLTDEEAKRLKTLAKKSVSTDKRADDLKQKLVAQQRDYESRIREMQSTITSISRDRDSWKANYERLWDEVKEFIHAIRKIPNRLRTFLHEIGVTKSKDREVSR